MNTNVKWIITYELFFILITSCLLCIDVFARDEEYVYEREQILSGEYSYQINDDYTVTITAYYGSEMEVQIPNEIDGYPVTGLGDGHRSVFDYNKAQVVIIPDSVISIGKTGLWGRKIQSFYVTEEHPFFKIIDGVLFEKESGKLVAYPAGRDDPEYYLPDEVTVIGESAFQGVNNLMKVVLSDHVKEIEMDAFKYSGIQSVQISKNIQKIVRGAFSGSKVNYFEISDENEYYGTIEGVLIEKESKTLLQYPGGKTDQYYEVPEGIESIADYAFAENGSIVTVDIPETVETIGDFAFMGCYSLAYLYLPSSLNKIGRQAFYGCGIYGFTLDPDNSVFQDIGGCLCNVQTNTLVFSPKLENETYVKVPEGIETIEDYAFAFSNLSEVYLPESLQEIGEAAFLYCDNLHVINLPSNLKKIGESAFRSNHNLTEISIPERLEEIGKRAFDNCHIEKLYVSPENPVFAQIKGAFFNKKSKTLLLFFNEMGITEYDIPYGVYAIADKAFYGDVSLQSITLPDTVKLIGEKAFNSCNSLETINLPESVKAIGEGTFDFCDNLTINVKKDTYAHEWVRDNNLNYSYEEKDDWLTSDTSSIFNNKNDRKSVLTEEEAELAIDRYLTQEFPMGYHITANSYEEGTYAVWSSYPSGTKKKLIVFLDSGDCYSEGPYMGIEIPFEDRDIKRNYLLNVHEYLD